MKVWGVLADNVSEIETSLADAGNVVNNYQVLVDEAQLKTANAIEKLPRWGALDGHWPDGAAGVVDR